MATTVKFLPRSLPAVDGLRFSCTGLDCVTKEKCIRWDHIYGNCSLPQQLKTKPSILQN